MSRRAGTLIAIIATAALTPVAAPTAPSAVSRVSGQPIEILADNGIEWQRGASIVRAVGNARAIRGDVEVRADVLSAFYRTPPGGSAEIWRLQADGGVVISTPNEKGYAEKGVYDVDSGVLVLSGGDRVRMTGKDDVEITADQQVEYWEQRRMVVARGNALARRADRSVRADILVAHLKEDAAGEMKFDRVEAFDDVLVRTPNEAIRADYGEYRAEGATAGLTGSVRITRGPNQLNGCRAEVDLNTGHSKLLACEPGEGSGNRVKGLIQSDAVKQR